MRVHELAPGTKFRVYGMDVEFELVRLGMGSAVVRTASQHREFEDRRTGGIVEFDAPGRTVTISLGTLVG